MLAKISATPANLIEICFQQ